ncbi:MAG TPA: elongation factor P maturation arginine rhamnosyltransferase EarP [Casimicrobiaceae bacterium]
MAALRWDVFCRVVDNYGDAGVCWRLARQLAAEHALDATLWIDRLATLARFEPAIDACAATQAAAGVTVRRLDDAAPPPDLPAVVIEAFGCGLPARYLETMAAREAPPLWLNLEYLSAEPWVEAVHAMASPQPRLALTRYFWFPGFTPHTGGLIREAGLLEARDAWRARETRSRPGEALRIVLFCYPNRALPALFDAWAESDEPVACTIPDGVATAALDLWLHGDVPHAGQSVARGRLALHVAPFASQDAFDRLLWGADVAFVRGEDSFVRAQWAARPFVWQPYPQEENAHRLKLDAFLARYAADLDAAANQALTAFWQAFNDEDGVRAAAAWPAFRAAFDALGAHGGRWADQLAALPELAAGLVAFAARRL